MIARYQAAASAAILAVMAGAGSLAALHAPPATEVAVHFGIDGRPNGWMRPWEGYLLLPATGALLWACLAAAPRLDPRGDSLRRSQAAYGVVWLSVTLLFAAIQAAIIAIGAGYTVGLSQLAGFGFGAFFVVAGNVMGKLRPNNVVGIRTPWTRADDRVWDKTHRLGGFVFVAAGLAMIALASLVHDRQALMPALAFVMVAAVAGPMVSSYWFWRRQRKEGFLS